MIQAAGGDLPKSARTRARILDAAARVLNERGCGGLRMSHIASLADMAAPAIYYHFPSRDDVIREVVMVGQQRTLDRVLTALRALPRDAPALDRIAAAVAAHLEVVLRDADYASAAVRNSNQLPEFIREELLTLQRQYGTVWRTLIDDGILRGEVRADLDPRAARMLILGALNWAPEWWNPERGTLEDTIDTAVRLVRAALAPQRAADVLHRPTAVDEPR